MHFSENESQLATRRKTESVAEIRVQDWFASKKKAKDTFFGMNALVRGDERHLLSVGMAVSAS